MDLVKKKRDFFACSLPRICRSACVLKGGVDCSALSKVDWAFAKVDEKAPH